MESACWLREYHGPPSRKSALLVPTLTVKGTISMSTFDPNSFLNAQLTDANSTTFVPCPPGEYHAVTVEEPKFRENQGKADPSKSYLSMDILWEISDPAVVEVTSRNPTRVRQSILIDRNDTGNLDMGKGKNIALGRLREAVGLNEPGKPFSFRQLAGQTAKVTVINRPDPSDPDKVYDEVKAVARA